MSVGAPSHSLIHAKPHWDTAFTSSPLSLPSFTVTVGPWIQRAKCTFPSPCFKAATTLSATRLPFQLFLTLIKSSPNPSAAYGPHVLPAIARSVRPRSPLQVHIARTYRWSATWTSSLPSNRNVPHEQFRSFAISCNRQPVRLRPFLQWLVTGTWSLYC